MKKEKKERKIGFEKSKNYAELERNFRIIFIE